MFDVMKGVLLLSILMLATSRCGKCGCVLSIDQNCKVVRAAAANRRFSYKLYRMISSMEGEDKNIFFSPLNIGMSIAMLLSASSGMTEEQIITGLNWQHTINRFQQIDLPCLYEFYNQATTIATLGNITLKSANKIYIKDYLPLARDVKNSLKKYGSGLEEIDFANPEQSRRVINSWVKQKTEGFIPELFDEGDITQNTAIALTSAIYFKGLWTKEFEIIEKEGMFITPLKGPVMTTFMEKKGNFKYIERNRMLFIELPYRKNWKGNCLNVSMILMSRQGKNLNQPIDGIMNEEQMSEIIQDLRKEEPQPASLRIPKFTISTKYNLEKYLNPLGIGHLFHPAKAELNFVHQTYRRMIPNLYVSKMIHKAYVEVNQEGTSAIVAKLRIKRTIFPHPHFDINESFTFLIYDHSRNSILFMGRITDPTAT